MPTITIRVTPEEKASLETLRDYRQAGWVLVALPPEFAEVVVDRPATQQNAFALSAHIAALKQQVHLLGGDV